MGILIDKSDIIIMLTLLGLLALEFIIAYLMDISEQRDLDAELKRDKLTDYDNQNT